MQPFVKEQFPATALFSVQHLIKRNFFLRFLRGHSLSRSISRLLWAGRLIPSKLEPPPPQTRVPQMFWIQVWRMRLIRFWLMLRVGCWASEPRKIKHELSWAARRKWEASEAGGKDVQLQNLKSSDSPLSSRLYIHFYLHQCWKYHNYSQNLTGWSRLAHFWVL